MKNSTRERGVYLVAGLLFGAGLIISGMVLPEKVIGFLDVTGDWDPSLALVMGGAILVHAPLVRWVQGRKVSIFGDVLQWPKRNDIDWKLVVGAALFGVGWGIAGVCPGPGIVDIVTFAPGIVAFVAAMLTGMFVHYVFEKRFFSGQKN